MELFAQLAEYGSVGVTLATLAVLIYISKGFMKLMGNHVNHSTEAIEKQIEVTTALKGLIEELLRKKK